MNGDIINYTDGLLKNKTIKNAVVQYANELACFTVEGRSSLTSFDSYIKNTEVIGNIYNNKDLLEGE